MRSIVTICVHAASRPTGRSGRPSGSSSLKNDVRYKAVDSAASETAVFCAIEPAGSADFGWVCLSPERRRDRDRLSRQRRGVREDEAVFSERKAHEGTAECVDLRPSWSYIDPHPRLLPC